MRAKLKRLHSPDIDELESWSPGDEPFGFTLQAMIGPSDSPGEESFNLTVCSPEWFAAHRMESGPVMGSRTLFVSAYDHRAIKTYLERAAQRTEGKNWREIAEGLSWLGEWEFEHYQP
jgi:Immunity protein 8